MQIHLIAIGEKMPRWVQEGYAEYAKRLPAECGLQLVEVAAGRRAKNADIPRIVRDEGERLLAAVPKGVRIAILDVTGKQFSTEQLADDLQVWMNDGRDIALLVGGPDGLSTSVRQSADLRWSLSQLTLPHPLVRIVVAEQLYRAWSILRNHPYHRG